MGVLVSSKQPAREATGTGRSPVPIALSPVGPPKGKLTQERPGVTGAEPAGVLYEKCAQGGSFFFGASKNSEAD